MYAAKARFKINKAILEVASYYLRFQTEYLSLTFSILYVFFDHSDDKEVVCVDEQKQSKGTVMKAKLLQFHENYRPAYYGTWRKNSKQITARKPLGQDKVNPL